MRLMWHIFCTDLKRFWRERWLITLGPLFLGMILVCFGISSGPFMDPLGLVGCGILWVALFLSTLFTLEGLFREDKQSGMLAQYQLARLPLSAILFAKGCAQWGWLSVPLALCTSLYGMTFGWPIDAILWGMLASLLGSFAMTFLGLIAVGATLCLPKGQVLFAILLLPLWIPILIFGSSVMIFSVEGFSVAGPIAWLLALSVLSAVMGPCVMHYCLRWTNE